ncbi:MAG: hypothetical protein HY060_05985 [Proteobacteria bacterium]|nr:hypothetical protein [Pseudomonadota bacterium]
MTEPSAAGRDAHGRFVPGCSGNPAGKPLGRRHDATLLKEMLRSEDIAAGAQVIADQLAAGNLTAARFVFDRLDPKPKPRGQLVEIAVPGGASLLERCQAVFAAMARGEITPDEAVEAARVIETERKVSEISAAKPAIQAEEAAAVRAQLARDPAIRAEVAAALRAELEPTIRAEVIAAMRAEIIAAIRTGLEPEFLGRLRQGIGDQEGSLNSPCISRDEPAAPSRQGAPHPAAQAAVTMAGSSPGAAMTNGRRGGGGAADPGLNSSCISRPTPALPEPDPAALRNPARWQNAARVDRMLRNAGAPAHR